MGSFILPGAFENGKRMGVSWPCLSVVLTETTILHSRMAVYSLSDMGGLRIDGCLRIVPKFFGIPFRDFKGTDTEVVHYQHPPNKCLLEN